MLPPQAIFTAAKCSATLPTSGTMIRPMKTSPMPVSSMVGSMALTSTSESTPVAMADSASTMSARRTVQRARCPSLGHVRLVGLLEGVHEVAGVEDRHDDRDADRQVVQVDRRGAAGLREQRRDAQRRGRQHQHRGVDAGDLAR